MLDTDLLSSVSSMPRAGPQLPDQTGQESQKWMKSASVAPSFSSILGNLSALAEVMDSPVDLLGAVGAKLMRWYLM